MSIHINLLLGTVAWGGDQRRTSAVRGGRSGAAPSFPHPNRFRSHTSDDEPAPPGSVADVAVAGAGAAGVVDVAAAPLRKAREVAGGGVLVATGAARPRRSRRAGARAVAVAAHRDAAVARIAAMVGIGATE